MRWLLALVVAVAVVALAACGGGGNDEESPTTTATEESAVDAARRVEADNDPSLPGEFVDLQTIYVGYYGATDATNTGAHVTRKMDYATEQGLPPAGGPHWGSGACGEDPTSAPPFCGPVDWGIYREPWDAESLVHSMEHAGLVVWYNTTDQQVIDELEALVERRLRADELIVLTPYPEMEDEMIAITGWGRRDKFPVSQYTPERVEMFLDAMRCRFNPEMLQGAGC